MQIAVRRLRVRRIRRLLLAVGVLVLALVGVALLPQGLHRGALTVATVDRAGDANGVAQGRVSATRSGDRACFAVAAAQGPMLLVFPSGWSADTGLRLLDAAGQTRVRPGTVMAFLGSPGAVGTVSGCPGTGRIWTVTDVRLPSLRR
jgi:phosphotransferase system  glucose/maltose/N-acetylglucosamine-specific IIC component